MRFGGLPLPGEGVDLSSPKAPIRAQPGDAAAAPAAVSGVAHVAVGDKLSAGVRGQ